MVIKNFGIELLGESIYEGYLKYCGNTEKYFVFREELENGKSNNIYVDIIKKSSYKKKNEMRNISAMCVDLEGEYYLCKEPLCIIVKYFEGEYQMIDLAKWMRYTPLAISVVNDKIVVTLQPALLLIFSKKKLIIEKEINLCKKGGIEPIFVSGTKDGCLIVTDSSNHTVTILDNKENIIWQYGVKNSPGVRDGKLCVPTSAFLFENRMIISEQRSHRISLVDKKGNILGYFGKTNRVGGDGELLWAPQATLFRDELYIVMCKGAVLSISKVDMDTNRSNIIFGKNIIMESDLNFPRACEYSEENSLLAIADTYHDRIILYNMKGEIVSNLDRNKIPKLSWPRSVYWIKDKLIITDSLNDSVYMTTISGEILEKYCVPVEIHGGQWLQSAEILGNRVLLSFEKHVLLMRWDTKEVLWCSEEKGLKLNDVHYAQLCKEDYFIISDTGNNRGIVVDKGSISYIEDILSGTAKIALKKPRMIKQIDNLLYIVSSAESKVYVCERKNLKLLDVIGTNRGLSQQRFSIPRWLCAGPGKTLFISDTDNHRIVQYLI